MKRLCNIARENPALVGVALAILAAFAGRPAVGLSYGAIVIGGVGLLLYDATLSVPAILIATILLVRAPERRSL